MAKKIKISKNISKILLRNVYKNIRRSKKYNSDSPQTTMHPKLDISSIFVFLLAKTVRIFSLEVTIGAFIHCR